MCPAHRNLSQLHSFSVKHRPFFAAQHVRLRVRIHYLKTTYVAVCSTTKVLQHLRQVVGQQCNFQDNQNENGPVIRQHVSGMLEITVFDRCISR